MITKFKIYEAINQGKPEVGDYVICDDILAEGPVKNFILNNIGKYITYNKNTHYSYIIEYDNIPNDIIQKFKKNAFHGDNCKRMGIDEIKYWSKDKEELEEILAENKYNL